jgi:NAD(P)H-hydrate epimerase
MCGEITVVDIGIPTKSTTNVIRSKDVRALLPHRKPDSNKGTYGHAVAIGGSAGKSGAPYMSGKAALRAGAGLVTIVTPASIQPIVAALGSEIMTHAVNGNPNAFSKEAAPATLEFLSGKNAVAIGPGIGTEEATGDFLRELIPQIQSALVIDADGLNVLAESFWHGVLSGPCVITPHPGELSRLLKIEIPQVQSDREGCAIRTADLMRGDNQERLSVCLLKGENTVVTDGERVYINKTGNPGMATGGTGDVLTGVIAALLGQNLSTFESAVLGAHIHGLSGDLAARDLGEVSMIASDLLDYLPQAFLRLS